MRPCRCGVRARSCAAASTTPTPPRSAASAAPLPGFQRARRATVCPEEPGRRPTRFIPPSGSGTDSTSSSPARDRAARRSELRPAERPSPLAPTVTARSSSTNANASMGGGLEASSAGLSSGAVAAAPAPRAATTRTVPRQRRSPPPARRELDGLGNSMATPALPEVLAADAQDLRGPALVPPRVR